MNPMTKASVARARSAALCVTLATTSVSLASCTNENHPPRTRAVATGVFAEVFGDDGECGVLPTASGINELTFNFRRQGIVGAKTLTLRLNEPFVLNTAQAATVSAILDPDDVDACEQVVRGDIRFERQADVNTPPGANVQGFFEPIIIHSWFIPEQDVFGEPLFCDEIGPIGRVPESRLVDARLFCDNSTRPSNVNPDLLP